MSGKMDVDGQTRQGAEREQNDDQFFIADLARSLRVFRTSLDLEFSSYIFGNAPSKLLMVADGDGQGEYSTGNQASSIAIDGLAQFALNKIDGLVDQQLSNNSHLHRDLRAGMEHCQQMLAQNSKRRKAAVPMSASLMMALIHWPDLHLVNAGNCCAYLLRDGKLRLLSQPATIEKKFLDEVESVESNDPKSETSPPQWNVLGGGDGHLTVEMFHDQLQIGDSLLICTKGISHYLSPNRLKDILSRNVGAEETCSIILDEVSLNQTNDDATIVLAKFLDLEHGILAEEAEVDIEQDLALEKKSKPTPSKAELPDSGQAQAVLDS